MSVILDSYEDFKYHGYRFNLYFCAFTAIFLACLTNFILALVGFFDDISKTWIAIILSCVIPIIVYVAKSHDYGIQVAYYKRWFDSIRGALDRNKILKQFAHTYGISSWRKKLKKIETDGRWHFHANTNYVKTLASERDSILREIEKDFIKENARIDNSISSASRNLEKIKIEFDSKYYDESETIKRLNSAKSSGEIYVQRKNAEDRKQKRVEVQQKVSELEYEVKILETEKNELKELYDNNKLQVELVYGERYRRYAEHAVKKINEVNGLKYDLESMEG